MTGIRASGDAARRPAAPLPGTAATVAVLTALAALGQFASNVYTPSLPAVARHFGVAAGEAQLTLAVFLASFAVSQLLFGPVSDRFGRRPVLFAGLAVFLAGTAACALATGFGVLLAGRVVQAAGAAATIVMSRAMTRDSFEGAALMRVLATISIAFALVPGLTPLLGGVLEQLGGWRAAFVATFLLGLGALAAAARLPETNARPVPLLDLASAAAAYRQVLGDPVFRTYSLAAAGVMASMSAFFAGSPALFMDRLGVSPIEYGLYPPLAVTGFVLGGLVTRRLAGKVPPGRIAATGLALLAAGAALMLGLPLASLLSPYGLTGAMVVHVTGLGVFLPTAVGAALGRFPRMAGSAAAMQGFLQMGGGALGAVAVSLLQGVLPVLAFPVTMVIAIGAAVAAFALGRPDRLRVAEARP